MITTFYPPYNFGGDGIFVYRLSNVLAKRGHTVDIIHCKDAFLMFQPKGPGDEFPNHTNITVHGLKSRYGVLSPLLTQQTGYPLLKKKKIDTILKNKKFDVIHYHNISLVGGPKLLTPRKEITLYTLHEHWLVCPMHVLWKYNKECCTKQSCFLCALSYKKLPQLWRYIRILDSAVKNVDCFIAPSIFTLRKHTEMGLHIPTVHIPHFLPYTEQDSTKDEHPDCTISVKPYFLFVGRLEKIKGLQKVIRAFNHFTKASLLIAGEGSYKDTLKQLADGNEHIQFLGNVNYKKLRELYKNAVAVIIPSLCYEVFGMIILEAFAMKTPVIVNNIGALPEIVEHSKGGIMYSSDSELTKMLESLVENQSLRNILGEEGYKAFNTNWTEEKHLEKYFHLIYEIADKKNSNSHLSLN